MARKADAQGAGSVSPRPPPDTHNASVPSAFSGPWGNAESVPTPPIAKEISAATSQFHDTLSSLIVNLMPLALPPKASSPSLYTLGILPFASIYRAFEEAFDELGRRQGQTGIEPRHWPQQCRVCALRHAKDGEHGDMIDALRDLVPPCLRRSDRLKCDVCFLRRRAEVEDRREHSHETTRGAHDRTPESHPPPYSKNDERGHHISSFPLHHPFASKDLAPSSIDYDTMAEAQSRKWLKNSGLRLPASHPAHDFIKHVRRTCRQKPHVLIAYTWTWYMAIFAGGRWIRSQLASAGRDRFWDKGLEQGPSSRPGALPKFRLPMDVSEIKVGGWLLIHDHSPQYQGQLNTDSIYSSGLGYAFLSFAGNQDGEDIKDDFIRRLSRFEDILTKDQRADIINEAKEIVSSSIAIVRAMDKQLRPSPHQLMKSEIEKSQAKRWDVADEEAMLVKDSDTRLAWLEAKTWLRTRRGMLFTKLVSLVILFTALCPFLSRCMKV